MAKTHTSAIGTPNRLPQHEPPGINPAVPYAGFLARGPGTHPPTSWPIRDLRFVSYLQVAARRIATTRACGTAGPRGAAAAAKCSRPRVCCAARAGVDAATGARAHRGATSGRPRRVSPALPPCAGSSSHKQQQHRRKSGKVLLRVGDAWVCPSDARPKREASIDKKKGKKGAGFEQHTARRSSTPASSPGTLEDAERNQGEPLVCGSSPGPARYGSVLP